MYHIFIFIFKSVYLFCGKGKNNLKHYVEEIRERFTKVGKNKEEILRKLCDEELDEVKGELIRKLWKKREIVKRMESKEDREKMYR